MSLDETKEKIEWHKRALEYESSDVIENRAKVIYIHDHEVKNIAQWDLLHNIINPSKSAKNIIAITLLLYINVWILEKVDQSSKIPHYVG